jgi:hypothetical protein
VLLARRLDDVPHRVEIRFVRAAPSTEPSADAHVQEEAQGRGQGQQADAAAAAITLRVVTDAWRRISRDIRDVAAPAGIKPGALGLEVPDDEVGAEGSPGIGDHGPVPSSAVPALQSGGPASVVRRDGGAPGPLALEHAMQPRGPQVPRDSRGPG